MQKRTGFIQKISILILIGLIEISVSSFTKCQKLKNIIETDYIILHNGSTLDTLGTLTLNNNAYRFTVNPSFPERLKKFAPPFIFTKPHGLYKWKADLKNTCIDRLNFDKIPIQELEFDPSRTKPNKKNRFALFEDNMNHRFGVLFYNDSIISMQMGLNHTHWIVQSQ